MATHDTEIKVTADTREAQQNVEDLGQSGDEAIDKVVQKAKKVKDALKDSTEQASDSVKKDGDVWWKRLLKRLGNIAGENAVSSVKSGSATPMAGYGADVAVAGFEEVEKDIKAGRMPAGGIKKFLMRAGLFTSLAGAAAIGIGMSKQAALSQRVGQLESSLGFAELAGVGPEGGLLGPQGDAWRMHQAKMGYTPEQAVQMAREYTAAIGYRRTGPQTDYGKLALSGASVGAIGAYDALNAPGRNVVGGNVERVLAMAFAQGLRATGLDRFVQGTAELMAEIGSKGVTVNAGTFENFMGRMLATPGLKDAGESGIGAMRGLTETGMDVRQSMLSPGRNIAQALIRARIFSAGGGISGIVKEAERYAADPELGRKVIAGSGLSDEMKALAMQGITGLTGERAKAMLSMSDRASEGELGFVDPASRARIGVDAERQARTIGRVESVEAYKAQSRAAEMLESAALSIGKASAGLLKVVGDLL